jgi:hypothetical protein
LRHGLCAAVHAQTDPKTELAKKVVALQQGPELDRLVGQLAGSTAQDLIIKWGPQLEANVPKAKQKKPRKTSTPNSRNTPMTPAS